MKKNNLNFAIPAATLKEATESLELFMEKLKPYLLTDITNSELDGYARLGNNTLPFVTGIIENMEKHPEFVPPYCKVNEAKADMEYYSALNSLLKTMSDYKDIMQLNRDLAGVEALDFAHEMYNIIRRLNNAGDPVGKRMFDEVKTRYFKPKRKDRPTQGT